ncbi:hypothetical protein ACLB1R_06925 [Escherichia coli]
MASGVFTGALTDPALADRKPLWQYAEKLDHTYCAGCHAPIAADHYTVNAWPSIAKGMGARTTRAKRTGHFNAVFPVQRQRYYRETVILVDQQEVMTLTRRNLLNTAVLPLERWARIRQHRYPHGQKRRAVKSSPRDVGER